LLITKIHLEVDGFEIPEEGFGFSNNPTIGTS